MSEPDHTASSRDASANPVIAGAEAWSHAGDRRGALCLHGFTGNPSSMRPVAEALAAAGFTVELPRLPGHGTAVADMLDTRWRDWTAAAEAAYDDLAARCDAVVVCGLSMGGSLALWLAARHPSIAGLALVNPLTQPPTELVPLIEQMVDAGESVFPGIGSDIAKEGATESAYPETPLAAALSLFEGVGEITDGFGACHQPMLLLSSVDDHVVPPPNGDHLAATWGGAVQRVRLERSFHVATLDHDAELICAETVRFAGEVSGA